MMVQETRMLLGHLVWNDGNFMEAFTADYSFLNADLARLYGLPAPAGEFELVQVSGGASRVPACSDRRRSSRRRRSGRDVADRARHLRARAVAVPARAESAARREYRIARADDGRCRPREAPAHASSTSRIRSCASCHRLMDPIGFGLENYDAVGRWRDQEVVEFETAQARRAAARRSSADIDATGEIAGLANSAFADPRRSAAAGRQPRLPGMRRQAGVPLRVRPSGNAGRPDSRLQPRSAAFRESGFKFKELLIALGALAADS